ncbi:MAG: hypothetical protein E6J90_19150 [Deltaproteobacteria bacterium]|nr:MAG: hypothetical protein E6J90_19150 [Deltaproteobacteria bacterium]
MAKSKTSQRDEQHELTRRALIKWSIAAGGALGVSRSKIFEVLEKTAGKGVAFAATESPITRVFDIEWGTGSLAWMTQLWPFPKIAKARNPAFSWGPVGMEQDVAGTHNPLVKGPNTPWQNLAPEKQITVFIAGNNETHKELATSTTLIGGSNVLALNTSLQAVLPAVLPAIAVGQNMSIGTGPGSATAAAVGSPDGMVDLFNSAASSAGGLLTNTNDAQLYAAHYQAFIQLNRAANRSTERPGYTTAQSAAKFLGTNLKSQLAVTPDDLTRYGINAGTRTSVAQLGRAMIIGVKAMKMGLTNLIQVRGFNDDPHGAFASQDFMTVPAQLKLIYDGFMADLQKTIDDNNGQPLADDIVIINKGDTFKTPVDRVGWNDNSSSGSNALWVYGAGHLYSGFFGDIGTNDVAQGVDATGKLTTYSAANTAKQALAAILYAVAKRDDRLIQNFVGGVQASGVFGPAKNV